MYGYAPADRETLRILSDLIGSKQPIFAMPSWFITEDSAQAGYLLSEAVRELTGRPPGFAHRTFFANSRYEALHGAIKLIRHHRLGTVRTHHGRVLALDPAHTLGERADPLDQGPERALVPGLVCVRTLDEALKAAETTAFCGLVVREPDSHDLGQLTVLAARLRSTGAKVALDLSDFDFTSPTSPAAAALGPDLIVSGESLTGHQVPYGAFTGTHEVFSPWAAPGTAFLHSNTYGGNTVAMRAVKAHLLPRWDATAAVHPVLAAAERDWEQVLRLYERHVNPGTVRMHRKLRGALRVVRADGARLTVQMASGRRLELVDGLCGAGLGVNGHNPADALTEVVQCHDPGHDYLAELRQLLARDTGLDHLLPAVSGASAVETALTMAVLARPGHRRMVVFRHNYGGKTLVSLNATAATRTRAPFGPLYPDVRYIDPFGPRAAEELRAELASGEVGLVWIELVHGSSDSYGPIPGELLDIVSAEREQRGFLVGVDEILTSYYRCGTRFAHQGRLPEVDLITVSKALSYGCFPIGAALVSDAVYQAARSANAHLVDELATRHINQLGAHFAVQAIRQTDALGLEQRVAHLSKAVQDGLARLDPASHTVGRFFAEGLLGRIEVLPPRPLRRFIRPDGELMSFALMLWWITRARAFVVYDIFLLPLIATPEEIEQVMRGARRLSRTGPYALLAQAALAVAEDRVRGALAARLPFARGFLAPEKTKESA